MELRADRGRAVLVGAPAALELPPALAGALHEWAEVATAVSQESDTDPETIDLVSARGRQLATRLAATVGTEVGYADPVRGVVERVPAPAAPATAAPATAAPARTAPAAPVAPEPTPWATGITVSAFVGAVVLAAVVTLTSGLSDVAPLLAVFGNLVVAAGLAPSVWMTRHTPVWRWVAYGVVVGIAVAWVVLLLGTLGPVDVES